MLLLGSAFAADDETAASAAGAPVDDMPIVDVPADEYNRGTPRRTADGFSDAAEAGDFERAANYLDLRNLRGAATALDGAELARRLNVIVRRATWIDVDELVDHPDGRGNDGLPSYRDSVGLVLDEGREVRILLQKVPRGDGVFIWKVSNASVSLIPELYELYGYPEAVEKLRQMMPGVTFLGIALFKWTIVLTAALLTWLGVFIFAWIIRRRADTPGRRRLYSFLTLPFALWLVIIVVNSIAESLGTSRTAEDWASITPVPTLLTIWMLFVGTNLGRDYYSARLTELQRPGAALMMRPAANALKLIIVTAAALVYLDKLGINITTVLAGLGVGGVAVALALQKPLEDVFGAITLYTQQPVRLGDFCRIGEQTGTVEEIGLRTTRIRTLADTVIAVPNARMAMEAIDNISARNKILFNPLLRLRLDTSPETMQTVLENIRTMLTEHADVSPQSLRVRFKSITQDALQIEVFAYVTTTDWQHYLEIAEGLNTQIIGIIAAAGTTLAPPVWELAGGAVER